MEQKKYLLQELKKLPKGSVGEHLINIFKAVAATTPFCGGIASLMSDYIPSSRFKRLEEFAKIIAADVGKLGNRLDENLYEPDEFAFMLEQCFRGVAENYQKEKLDFFRGILINSVIDTNLSNYEKEYFLNLVNNFSVLHIRILKFLVTPIEYLTENGISQNQIQGGFKSIFRTAIPDVDIKLVETAFGDLYQSGFVSTKKDIFNTMTSGQGLNLLGDRTTDLAKKFIKFCTVPEN